jgi:thiol-disulfide isomerase/thioredoxin
MWIKTFLLILLCSLNISCSQNEPVFKDTQDQSVQLSTLKGKWVVINYWAPWCPSCIHEIPELNHFYKQVKNKNILIYGVNFDAASSGDFKQAVQKAKIEFPVLLEDPDLAWKLGNVNAIPTTFIIDPTGKVAKTLVGPTTEKSLTAILDELQKSQP